MYSDSTLDVSKLSVTKEIIIPEEGLILKPNELYLGITNEWTETYNLIPMMSGRSSLGRNGLHVHCSAGMGSIGYKGCWHSEIKSVRPIKAFKDTKCCQIYYFTPDEK